jgi:hypothetical protein
VISGLSEKARELSEKLAFGLAHGIERKEEKVFR